MNEYITLTDTDGEDFKIFVADLEDTSEIEVAA